MILILVGRYFDTVPIDFAKVNILTQQICIITSLKVDKLFFCCNKIGTIHDNICVLIEFVFI